MELMFGDCRELMPLLPPASIDLILCDLPYGTTNCAWDVVIPFDVLWREYKRLLKPTGTVVLFGNQPFTSLLIASNLPWFKQCLVWNKNKCGSPGLAKVRPMQTHEDIAIFAPGRTTYNPIMETGKPYSRKSKSLGGYVGRCNNHGYGLKPRVEFSNPGIRYPKSILNISRDFSAQQQIHPAQKPVALMEWLVQTYSNPGDVILDNAMGSAPVGEACVRTGRKYIGMENDVDHFLSACERIARRA